MRLAIVHSFYANPNSGENEVVLAEVAALRRAGVDIVLIRAAGADSVGVLRSAHAAFRVVSGFGRSPEQQLAQLSPDLIHVHNLFPSWSTRWLVRSTIPFVATLHNYRAICAAAVLTRDGRPCFDCVGRLPIPAVRHACYRGNRVATLPLALAQVFRGLNDPLFSAARRLYVPSAAVADNYASAGLRRDRVSVRPPFLPAHLTPSMAGPINGERRGFLFVGRLSAEKGLQQVLPHWPDSEELLVVGDGPMRRSLSAIGPKSVVFVGREERGAVVERMRRAEAVIVPSIAPETFGLVYMEALAAGTPLIASEHTVPGQLVSEQGTGVTVSDWRNLREAIDGIRRDAGWQAACRSSFDSRYTEEAWVQRALADYRAVLVGSGLTGSTPVQNST